MSDSPQPERATVKCHDTNTFTLAESGKTIVTIKADGSVVLGELVTLDEASRAFWSSVEGLAKQSRGGG